MTMTHPTDKRYARFSAKQGGSALFFALIGLVVLLLAAAALIRSVDTATLIAGNLSFKQAATTAGDLGVNQAITWLNTNQNSTDNDSATSGYYSSIRSPDYGAVATWGSTVSASAGEDSANNNVRYIIERLCRAPNQAPTVQECLYGDGEAVAGNTSGDVYRDGPGAAVMYRVTVRVVGPRNTVSYAQAIVY